MSPRRPSVASQGFSSVIFSNEYLSAPLCLEIYNGLLSDSSQLSDILTDDDISLKLLSDFEIYTKRIAQFLTIVKNQSTVAARQHRSTMAERDLRKKIVEQFLLQLLGDDFKKFHSQPAFMDLIAAIIQFNLPSYPGALKLLAARLGDKSELLGSLISGEGNSSVMKGWIATFRSNNTIPKIFESWTSTFITLCKNCENNHGVSQQIHRWHKLRELRERLKAAQEQARNNAESQKSSHRIPLYRMRKLSDDDKKSASGRASQVPTTSINLSKTDLANLEALKIAPPSSERGILLALEKLEKDEMLSIMQNLVVTFPCRLCNEARERHAAEDNSFSHTEIDQPRQFSELFGQKLGIWRVHLSARALKDFEESNYEGNFEHIKKKLIDLASGDWKHKSLVKAAGSSIQREKVQGTLREAVYGSNGRILWQVDVDFDENTNNVTQVVKIWKIGDHKEMEKAINCVLHVLKNYSVKRMEACKQTKFEKSSGRNLPIEFTDHSVLKLEQNAHVESVKFDSEDGKAFESILLSNKFYALTETVVDNIVSRNVNVEFPLIVSEEELSVIKSFKTSTLVLGRSGTGKTTCLVYKLLSRYLATSEVQQGKPPRQILLTRSPMLAYKLGRQTKRLIDSQRKNITGKVEDDLFAGIDSYEKEVTDTITSLKDEDFPLACTFDHFLKILENTIRHADRKDFSIEKRRLPIGKKDQMPGSNDYGGRGRSRFLPRKPHTVDFQIFKDEYWCTFPYHLTNKFPDALAFMEIMGIIKGSASPESRFEPLSKEEYLARSFRLAPTFTGPGEREQIYDIYERYERKKSEQQALDNIDRVVSILRAILENEDLKKKVGEALDEVYVDEVQDQRLLEIELLVNLVKDPRGIHFAGDTAQCISKDSTFRFEEVKALLFRNFGRLSTIANAPELARPKLIKLDKNFRAHQGILSFASFVMKILWTEFPAMVDKLPPEIGQYLGPKPTILVSFDSFFTSVLQSVELRSEQVIIVRNKEDKERLRKDIGPNRKVLILTILESKGMEFDDVFLLNFFTTSECRSSFRVLAMSGNTEGLKHIALCTELKQLYVAITRPRSRLWLFESDPSSITSIVELLEREPGQPLVDIVPVEETHADESVKWVVDQISYDKDSKRKNLQEWSTRGLEFLHRQDYENAKFCFENAEDKQGIKMAQAFIEEQQGRSYRALGKEEEFKSSFRKAAKLFHDSKLPFKEATCLEYLEDFKEAAVIFSAHREYGKAASLFELAQCYEEASKNYVRGGNYEEGAGALRRGGLFDRLVCYLNEYRASIDSNTQSHYSKLCNLLLKQGKISSHLETMAVEALGSDSKKEDFYRDFGMTDKLKDFYMAKKKYSEMFYLAVQNGEIENAWSLVENHDLHREIPQTELVELFNYIQAGSLETWLSSESEETLTRDTIWYPKDSSIPEVSAMRHSWQQLAGTVNYFQHKVTDYQSIRFEEDWMKSFFSIIVTVNAAHFIDAANIMSELPIEFINQVTNIAKSLAPEEEFPPSLLLYLGIFPVLNKEGTYWLLDWSPLNSGLDCASETFDIAAIVDKARKWVLDRLYPAITQMHDKAWEIMKKQYPIRCYSYLTTLRCRKWSRGICELPHTLITKAEVASRTKDLLRMSSVYNTFNLLYNRYGRQPEILDHEFSKSFTGLRRIWTERLFAQITFFSSFEHDAGNLTKTHCEISCESSEFSGVLGGLEDLVFRRIRHEWEKRHNFSYLLEQLQHAETLGVAHRYMKCLTYAFRSAPQYAMKNHTHRTLKEIRYLRYEKVLGSSKTHAQYTTILSLLEQFTMEDFPSFHSIVTFYEKLATFLIYMIRPTDFLIPHSWVQMYLLQMPGFFAQEGQAGQSGTPPVGNQQVNVSQHWHQQSLLSVVESFCTMISYILDNGGVDGAVTTISAGDRFPKPRQFLARRQIEFLAVTMANLRSILPLPKDIGRVWNTVQTTVVRLSVDGGDWGGLSHLMLAAKLFEMIRIYKNKDFLLIVTEGGKASRAFSGLHVVGVSTVSVDRILSSRPQRAVASVRTSNAESQQNSDYSKKEEQAAKIIQNFWRTRYPRVRQWREFVASPIGKAHIFIQTLREKIVKKRLHPKEQLKRTILLIRDGTELYQRVKDLEGWFEEIKNISKEQLENKALTVDQLETLQILWEELPKIRRTVPKEVTIYTEKSEKWLDWSPKELEEKYNKTKAFLDDVEAELNQRTKELEKICKVKLEKIYKMK